MSRESRGLRSRRAWTPERVFVAIALVWGLFFAVTTPPHDPPDEIRHFTRAYLIAEGHLSVAGRADGYQVMVPSSLIEIHRPHGSRRLRHDFAQLRRALSVPLNPAQRTRMQRMTLYTPAPHLPQAAAIAVGRVVGLPPAPLLYLGRLANLLFWVGAGWLSIRVSPFRKWALVLLSLTPTALYQAGSLSADAPSHAFALLFFALVLRSAYAPEHRVDRRDAVQLAVAAALVGVGKPGYWPLAALALLIPPERFSDARARRWTLAFCGLAVLLPSALWAFWVKAADPIALSNRADPAAQLAWLQGAPAQFLVVLLTTLWSEWLPWVAGITGVLGQLDIALPLPLYALYPAAVLYACVADRRDPPALTPRRRGFLVGLFILCSVCMLTMGYLGWNRVGSPLIVGVQGRYFIPMAPLLMLAIPSRRSGLPAVRPLWVGVSCSAVLAIAAYVVTDYYYFL